jgi:Protein of unknown function (DUF3486).
VTQVAEWAMSLGYTFSRSAWGRFMTQFLKGWDENQVVKLQARAFAKEFAGEAGFEISDMAGYVLQKKALELLQSFGEDEEDGADKLRALAQALTSVTRSRVQTEKLRQTAGKARLEAYMDIEAELRRSLAEERPELWEELQEWLAGRIAEARTQAEAA